MGILSQLYNKGLSGKKYRKTKIYNIKTRKPYKQNIGIYTNIKNWTDTHYSPTKKRKMLLKQKRQAHLRYLETKKYHKLVKQGKQYGGYKSWSEQLDAQDRKNKAGRYNKKYMKKYAINFKK